MKMPKQKMVSIIDNSLDSDSQHCDPLRTKENMLFMIYMEYLSKLQCR